MKEYIKYDTGTFSSLTKEQKEAVALLSIGTFLEYFDLMLYVHMAVLLNELFFPKASPHTQAVYAALAFCSTYVLRPFGALIFGWLGDIIGRKFIVVITTFMMAFSCFVMFLLPTYKDIGITATILITICRIIQSLSSFGEVIGAGLYITEITKPPIQYSAVSMTTVFAELGSVFSLIIATLSTIYGLNWRLAFLFGTIVALIGTVARMQLKESAEFANAKHRIKNKLQIVNSKFKKLINAPIVNQKVNIYTVLSYIAIGTTGPLYFYFLYIHCGQILKILFHYKTSQIIQHNLLLNIVELCVTVLYTYLSYKIHPLKILKVRLIIFASSILALPYCLNNITSPFELLLLQSFITIFKTGTFPAVSVLYSHFPILARFRYISFSFAFIRAVMYVVTSFGLVYLTEIYSNWGILMLFVPFLIIYRFGLYYFIRLEKLNTTV